MHITEEALEPRDFGDTTTVKTKCRHFRRYLTSIEILDQYTDLDYGKSSVLDFGCGSGYGTSLLYEFFNKAVGYDPNPRTLEGTHRTNVLLLKELPTTKFDVVFLIEVFEHVDNPQQLLDQIKSVAGKYVVLTTPVVRTTNTNPTNPFHKIEYSLLDFLKEIEKGFDLVIANVTQETFTDGETKGQGIFVLEIK